jgi:hypothetical protein
VWNSSLAAPARLVLSTAVPRTETPSENLPMTPTRRLYRLALRGFAVLSLAAALPLAAQSGLPELDAGATGKGTFTNRASNESQTIERAVVHLRREGEFRIELQGRGLELVVLGRMTSWNGRQHVELELAEFDGRPSDATGWVKLDGRGGFERIEMSGKTPIRLSVDFFAERGFAVAPWQPSSPPSPRPPDRPGPPGPSGQGQFTEDWGMDRPGNDLRNLKVERLDQCHSLCWNDSRCQAYAFNQSSRVCYLKSAPGYPSPRRDVVSGVRKDGPGAGQGAYGLTEVPGLDQPGNDYVDFRARDLRDCQRSCAEDPRCRAYTFNTRSGQCYLKSYPGPTRSRSDTITGEKRER